MVLVVRSEGEGGEDMLEFLVEDLCRGEYAFVLCELDFGIWV